MTSSDDNEDYSDVENDQTTLKLQDLKHVSEEEQKFFHKFAISDSSIHIVRRNKARMAVPPRHMRFENFDKLPSNISCDEAQSKLIDIFIRTGISLADGDMETTHFSLGLKHPGLRDKNDFWIHNRRYDFINGYFVLNEMARFSQSNSKLFIDDAFSLEMHVFKNANKRIGACDIHNDHHDGKIYFDVRLSAPAYVIGKGKCLLKAAALAMVHANETHARNEFERTKADEDKTRNKTQMARAVEIENEVGLDPNLQEHTIEHLKMIAEHYPEYRFVLLAREPCSSIASIVQIFNPNAIKTATVGYKNGHYDHMRPNRRILMKSLCKLCGQFGDRHHHRKCTAICRKCGHKNCADGKRKKYICDDCNCEFFTQKCFANHKKKTKKSKFTFCEKFETCTDCNKKYEKSFCKCHICGQDKFCRKCRMHVRQDGHNCCHNPPDSKQRETELKKQEKFQVLVYDIESKVVDENATGEFVNLDNHIANVVCYDTFCNECINSSGKCESCVGANEITYNNVSNGTIVLQAFCNLLLTEPKLNGAIIIAHNGGRYDHHMVLAEMMASYQKKTTHIAKGNTLITATIAGEKGFRGTPRSNELIFKDSYHFLPMPLSEMPKAFGFEEMKKGSTLIS